MVEEIKKELWTADKLAEYLGIVVNEKFDENVPKNGPPFQMRHDGFLIQAIREQIIQAFRAAKREPTIVTPGMVRGFPK